MNENISLKGNRTRKFWGKRTILACLLAYSLHLSSALYQVSLKVKGCLGKNVLGTIRIRTGKRNTFLYSLMLQI